MSLQERIYKDIQDTSLKLEERNVLKVVKADIQKERDKEVPDKRVLSIIKSHIKGCEEVLSYIDRIDDAKLFNHNMMAISLLNKYLPKMASVIEIKTWIKDNIDFSQYKNKMQAMKPIMNHFGSTVDGKIVKQIIEGWKDE